jgi:hypothetical protein
MKSVLMAVMLMITFPLWSLYGSTHVTIKVTGGGTGTFADGKIDPWDIDDLDGDLDGDGDIDGSQFGMGVIMFADGLAQGHFECLMAGASDILGLPLMAVEG